MEFCQKGEIMSDQFIKKNKDQILPGYGLNENLAKFYFKQILDAIDYRKNIFKIF